MTCELVSIITPSLNHGKFISGAIQSVLSQDYPTIEYWIMDGGSSDGTIDVLNQYSNRIKWMIDHDDGLYDAVNKGWARTRGKYLGYLNADDMFCKGAIRQFVECLDKHPEVALVYGDYLRVDQNGRILELVLSGKSDIETLVKYGNTIFSGAMLIRRSVLEELGWFDVSYKYSSDYDLCIRIAQQFPIAHIPHPLAMFRIHNASKSQNSRWNMWDETFKISHKYSGHKYFSLYSRYWIDRVVHIIPQSFLWSPPLLHFRKQLRHLWKLGQ
jgi:glycosyltransferase involved in cell wall biosynthesis